MRRARRKLAFCLLVASCFALATDAQRFGGRGRHPNQPAAPAKSQDYYKLLGIPRTATDRAIKKAYRKMALKHHPDKVQDEKLKEAAKDKFVQIANAYDTLVDPEKRRVYDQLGEEGLKNGGQPGAGGFGAGGFPGGGGRSGFGGSFQSDDAFKMFEQMFGGGAAGGGGGARAQPPPTPPLERVTLTLNDPAGIGITLSRTNRVIAIKAGGVAAKAGQLRVGDQIYEIDGAALDEQRASQLLAASKRPRVTLGVAFEDPEPLAHRVKVSKGADGLGIKINAENEVTAIVPGGTAAKEGRLRVGDRILQVDGKSARAAKVASLLAPGATQFEFVVQPKLRVAHGGDGNGGGGFGGAGRQARGRPSGGFGGGAGAGAGAGGFGGFPGMGGGFGGFGGRGGGSGGGGGGFNMEDIMRQMGGMGGGSGRGSGARGPMGGGRAGF